MKLPLLRGGAMVAFLGYPSLFFLESIRRMPSVSPMNIQMMDITQKTCAASIAAQTFFSFFFIYPAALGGLLLQHDLLLLRRERLESSLRALCIKSNQYNPFLVPLPPFQQLTSLRLGIEKEEENEDSFFLIIVPYISVVLSLPLLLHNQRLIMN